MKCVYYIVCRSPDFLIDYVFKEKECLLTRLPHMKCIRLGSVRSSLLILIACRVNSNTHFNSIISLSYLCFFCRGNSIYSPTLATVKEKHVIYALSKKFVVSEMAYENNPENSTGSLFLFFFFN